MRQIDHAIKVCGVDHVGIGSDLSTDADRGDAGVSAPSTSRSSTAAPRAASRRRTRRGRSSFPSSITPRRIEGVVARLRQRAIPTATIEKIIGGNFHRVFKEIWSV